MYSTFSSDAWSFPRWGLPTLPLFPFLAALLTKKNPKKITYPASQLPHLIWVASKQNNSAKTTAKNQVLYICISTILYSWCWLFLSRPIEYNFFMLVWINWIVKSLAYWEMLTKGNLNSNPSSMNSNSKLSSMILHFSLIIISFYRFVQTCPKKILLLTLPTTLSHLTLAMEIKVRMIL